MNKSELRAAMKSLLTAVTPQEMSRRSAKVAGSLAMTTAWARTDVVLSFLSMPHEIDTTSMIAAARAAGKAVAVPRIDGGDIRFLLMPARAADLPRDAWGIPIPDPSWAPLDLTRFARPLVTAPGLAFDRMGNRLGRGKGYYDRFLKAARAQSPALIAIGVCLDEQLVEQVPTTGADEPLDGVVGDRETVLIARP
jgi:5-formyltetrahydrofolate cyclo-ligase